MSDNNITSLEAKNIIVAASKRVRMLYGEAIELRGPLRTEAIYELLSEVRKCADRWRKEGKKSKSRLVMHLNKQAGRNYKVARPPEFMLLRLAISDRRVSSAWAKVLALARKNRVPPSNTADWIARHGGIDSIIRADSERDV